MSQDLLEGVDTQPVELQVTRLIAASRHLSGAVRNVGDEMRYMKRAFYGLIFTILGGVVLLLFSVAIGWINGGG